MVLTQTDFKDLSKVTYAQIWAYIKTFAFAFEVQSLQLLSGEFVDPETCFYHDFATFMSRQMLDREDGALWISDTEKAWSEFVRIEGEEYTRKMIRYYLAFIARKIAVRIEKWGEEE